MMVLGIWVFKTADHSLTRVDKHALSQEVLMELFMDGILYKWHIYEHSKFKNDFSKWNGLKITHRGEILSFNWSSEELCGSVRFEWLPATIIKVNMVKCSLNGTLSLTCLPERMKSLELSRNIFEGEIDIAMLPNTLEVLDISNNYLVGNLDFTRLPPKVKKLYVQNNDFSGEADFRHLPSGIFSLDLSQTQLEGSIPRDWAHGKNINISVSKITIFE